MEVITTHLNADFDAVASMLAAKKMYPKAKLAFPGSQEKGLRDFFLQSTIYVLQAERIKNIDLEKITRLILVDIRQRDRIGRFKEIIDRKDVDIHIYDHHAPSENDIVGSVNVIEEVGATTTIFCRLFEKKKISVTPDEATIMMMGIYEDTGSLTFSSTTAEDFYGAAYLLKQGGNLNVVADIVSKELTAEQVSILYELIHTASVHVINGIDVVIATASTDLYISDFAVLVHKLRDMENINVLFVLAEMEGRVYLIARSRLRSVDVSKVALQFGGGGHPSASSATLKGYTLPQAEEKLRKILHRNLRPLQSAKDLMTSPVISADADESLRTVGERISKFQLNTLPVIKDSRMAGLVTREIVERAINHNLGELPVKEYMITDFPKVSPSTPWSKIQRMMLEENQRFLPVCRSGKVIGAISRTDMLRFYRINGEKGSRKVYDFDYDLSKVRKRDFVSQMEEQLPASIMDLMRSSGRLADEMGYQVFAVGGFVRDILLRQKNLDVDLVVEGEGIKFVREFARRYNLAATYHRKFGTARIVVGEVKIDVASARREYYEHPAALPIVELSTIRQDLYRRDFTINTLAIRLNPEYFGEMLDFFGAKKDVKSRVVKVIHNLSFIEDPTRIFRALRFEQRFGFAINKETAKLIQNAVRMDIPLRLSGHRIFGELQLILEEGNPPSIIRRMADFDLLRFFHPRLAFTTEMEILMESIREVLHWFELLFLTEKWEKWRVYLLGMADGLPEEGPDEFGERFAFLRKNTRKVLSERVAAQCALSKLQGENAVTNSAVYETLHVLSTEALLYIMAKTTQQRIKKVISNYITHLRFAESILTGEDLKKMGLAPGRLYKQVLDSLLRARLDGKVRTREDEIRFVNKDFLSGLPQAD
ncbi:MAG: CBS domain-containing protein [Deltaproteobacteria bacterium]|nr:CBS domain-containing protein [Deltaproteobacteria bacterium]